MKDGTGCIKDINCVVCAQFPFICNGLMKPSKLPKSKITQLKREAKLKAKEVKWYDC